MTDLTDPGKEVLRRIWVTKGSRFAAHRRLRRRYSWSIWTVSLLSIYVAAASLLGGFLSLSEVQKQALNAALAVAGVLILVVSLIEGAKSYELRAERLHDCAVTLGRLELRLQAVIHGADVDRSSLIMALSEEYSSTLAACPYNHDPIDFAVFKIQHGAEFKIGALERGLVHLRSAVGTVGPYLVAIATPVVIAWALWRVLPPP